MSNWRKLWLHKRISSIMAVSYSKYISVVQLVLWQLVLAGNLNDMNFNSIMINKIIPSECWNYWLISKKMIVCTKKNDIKCYKNLFYSPFSHHSMIINKNMKFYAENLRLTKVMLYKLAIYQWKLFFIVFSNWTLLSLKYS